MSLLLRKRSRKLFCVDVFCLIVLTFAFSYIAMGCLWTNGEWDIKKVFAPWFYTDSNNAVIFRSEPGGVVGRMITVWTIGVPFECLRNGSIRLTNEQIQVYFYIVPILSCVLVGLMASFFTVALYTVMTMWCNRNQHTNPRNLSRI